MKIEITYIPQGQKNVVKEQYEVLSIATNFFIKGEKCGKIPTLEFYAYEKINGKYEICSKEILRFSFILYCHFKNRKAFLKHHNNYQP